MKYDPPLGTVVRCHDGVLAVVSNWLRPGGMIALNRRDGLFSMTTIRFITICHYPKDF